MPARKKAKTRALNNRLFKRTALILILGVLVLFYVFLPQLKYFSGSIKTIQDAYFPLVCWALLLVIGSFMAAAATYCFLANFRLNYWRTLLIQVADGFTDRLLPAGAGGMATNLIYLSRRHGRVQAGMIVGLNNLIGFLGHMLLLLILLLINSATGGKVVSIRLSGNYRLVLVIAGVILLAVLLFRRRLAKFSPKNARALAELIKFTFHHPGRLAAAFGSSMFLTLSHAAALYLVMLSLNVHLTFLQTFLVMTAGVVVMAATPTPGGIGGAETGIVASQIALGVPGDQALSVALVYRLLTYWLPLLPGLIALRIALKKGYLPI